jgi:hypothetical protein
VGRLGLALGQDNIGLELDIDASTTDTAIGTFYGYSLENHLALQQPLLSPAVGLKAGIIPFFWGRNAVELGVDVMKWTNAATYSVGVYAAFSIDALPKDKKHTPAKGK